MARMWRQTGVGTGSPCMDICEPWGRLPGPQDPQSRGSAPQGGPLEETAPWKEENRPGKAQGQAPVPYEWMRLHQWTAQGPSAGSPRGITCSYKPFRFIASLHNLISRQGFACFLFFFNISAFFVCCYYPSSQHCN